MSRNIRSILSLAVVLLLPGMAAYAAESDAQLEAVRDRVAEMFDMIDREHINASPIDGWYEIHKGSIVAYISEDGRYLLQGDLVDLDLQVNLSEQSRSNVRRELVASLKDEESILFSPAEAKHSVTVFTDIDCTYCRRLHNEIDEYLDLGIAVRYVLYPRNGRGSRAWSTSEDVWCANDRNDALTAAKLDRQFETSECDASMIGKHYRLGQNVGLSGTPAIVLDDGTLIAGYLPAAALGARLNSASPN